MILIPADGTWTVLKQGRFKKLGNLEVCYAGVVSYDRDGEEANLDFAVCHCERSWVIHCCATRSGGGMCYIGGDNGDLYEFSVLRDKISDLQVHIRVMQIRDTN